MSTMDQRESLRWSHSLVPCFFCRKGTYSTCDFFQWDDDLLRAKDQHVSSVFKAPISLVTRKKSSPRYTLPETNSFALKMHGLKATSLLRPDLFSGPLAVSFKEGSSCDFFSNLVSCRRVALSQPFQRENHAWWWQVPPNVNDSMQVNSHTTPLNINHCSICSTLFNHIRWELMLFLLKP